MDWEQAGDVGLEYRALLKGKDKETKLIDLWASPFRSTKKRSAKNWHFVELKVAFNNANANKQLESWRADFEFLRQLDRRLPEQKPKSFTSVAFGVGFDREQFRSRSERAVADLNVEPASFELKTRGGPVFVAVLSENS